MHREADGAAGVGDAAGDRLADPPGGVGRELETLAPVELLDGVHEAEVALLDEVEQRQTRGLVLLRDRHHEAQVRLDELTLGFFALTSGTAAARASSPAVSSLPPAVELFDRLVAGLDGLRESNLVVLRQQCVLPDVGEVETDKVLVVSFDAIFRHRRPTFELSSVLSAAWNPHGTGSPQGLRSAHALGVCGRSCETRATIPSEGGRPTREVTTAG